MLCRRVCGARGAARSTLGARLQNEVAFPSESVENSGVRTSIALWPAALLSGGAALAYEICWSRALVVPLGNSSDATGIVLAGFMVGIALGAYGAGGLADRVRAPLRWYGMAEVVLVAFALAAPSAIPWIGSLPAGPASIVRLGAAGALVIIPCLAMGASLPLLVRALTREGGAVKTTVGLTYAVNTTGAAIGAVLAGFWGIGAYGVRLCSAMAAAASAAAAVLAIGASFGPVWARAQALEPRAADANSGKRARIGALIAAFVGGLVMLACEVVWARVLTFVFGHDTYAFASLLALVLVGLSLGGWLHRAFARRDQRVLAGALLAALSATIPLSFYAAASLVVHLGRDPFGFDSTRSFAASIHLELLRELAYTPVLVLLPSLLAGALFPAACALHAGDVRSSGRSVGIVGLVNGLGSAAGALIAAFGLVAWAGIQHALVLLACVSCAASVALLMGPGIGRHITLWKQRRQAAIALAAIVPTAISIVRLPADLPRSMLLRAVGEQHQTLLYYEEARTGTVSVTHNAINGEKVLMMNAVNEVTTRQVHDESFKLLGHLAPLLHPEPHKGVMICLGAGLSAGAATLHPLDRLDVIDLSSAVPHAAAKFAQENHHVLDNPVLRLHVDDGRQYLLNSAGNYDVAIVDSTHPKSVDSWILYTQEFYQLLKSRLGPGGIAVQWLPLHGLSEREFKVIARTFQSVFPEMTLWANVGVETYGQVGYAKLVGTDRPLVIDVGRVVERLARGPIHDDLVPYGMATLEDLLSLFVGGPNEIRDWTAGLPVQTDDRPMVPYTTELSSGRRMEPRLLLAVRRSVASELSGWGGSEEQKRRLASAQDAQGLVMAGMLSRASELHPDVARVQLYVKQQATTLPYYEALALRYAGDADRAFEAGTQLSSLGHAARGVALLERARALRPRDFRVRLNLALALGAAGRFDDAIQVLTELRDEQPGSAIVLHNLGAMLLAAGRPAEAIGHLRESIAWDPGSLGARQSLAEALLSTGEISQAQAQLEALDRANPWCEEVWELRGVAASAAGDNAAAAKMLQRSIELNSYRAGPRVRMGSVLRALGDVRSADDQYAEAMRLQPGLKAAVAGRAATQLALQRFESAADLYLQAIDIDSEDATLAYGLGVALRGQKRDDDAAQAFCLALRLDPHLAAAVEALKAQGRQVADCSR